METFPHVELLKIPVLVTNLKLEHDTLLEVLDHTQLPMRYWTTRTAQTAFCVPSTRRINDNPPRLFLRLLSDFSTTWLDADCPELDSELDLEVNGHVRKRRAIEQDQSLQRKASRAMEAEDVSAARRVVRTSSDLGSPVSFSFLSTDGQLM